MHAAEGRFVSLAEIIRSRHVAVPSAHALVGEPPQKLAEAAAFGPDPVPPEADPVTPLVPQPPAGPEAASAVRAARLFRAALADAFDALAIELTAALAADVLGRELHLGAVDIAAIVRRIIAERRSDEPLSVRVSPADAHIVCDLPVMADPLLGAGDAVLVCRNGEIDARLAVRLGHVLADFSA